MMAAVDAGPLRDGGAHAARYGRVDAVAEGPRASYVPSIGAIVLIRHGETDANAARVVQRPDVALSARGVEQARRLAARLAKRRVGAVVSSDLRRAVMTAETLRERIPVPLALDPGLRERDYGDVRGIAYADLRTDIFAPDYSPPNGETWTAFHARVAEAWTRMQAIAARTDGDLVIVTHGLVCHAIATRHLDLTPGTVVGMSWTHTSVTEIEGPPYRVARLIDCSAHLVAASDAAGPV